MGVTTNEACPRCATLLERHGPYPMWCPECGWNVEPQRPAPAPSRVDATQARTERWTAASALGDVQRTGRSFGIYRVATYAYSLLAYLVLAGCFAGGVALIVLTWLNPFAIVAGVVLLGIGYVAFPRPRQAPELIDRSQFAALHELADDVAQALGAHRVDGIAVSGEFANSFDRYGWRGRRIMTIGLPLFTVLDGQERVAAVAHEIARDVSRDPARSMFVRNAYTILVEVYGFLLPQEPGAAASAEGAARGAQRATATVGVAGWMANAGLTVVGHLVRPLLRLFALLMRRDSQRAEYRADGLAADVAGVDAARTVLRKLHLAKVFDNLARGSAAQGDQADILGALRRWVADAPPSEWERIERIMALEQTQVSSTQPPTGERIRFLAGRTSTQAQVVLDAGQRDAIDRELMPLELRFARDYVDEARSRLYRR